MTASATIRPALAADQEALGRLGSLLVTRHYGFDPKRFLAPRPDMPQAYGHFLAHKSVSRISWCSSRRRRGPWSAMPSQAWKASII